jgi:hypothetical protein
MMTSLKRLLVAVAFLSLVAFTSSEAQPERHRTGAVCNDGTTNRAIGSGACSHHGGVLCWQYSDGTCTKP